MARCEFQLTRTMAVVRRVLSGAVLRLPSVATAQKVLPFYAHVYPEWDAPNVSDSSAPGPYPTHRPPFVVSVSPRWAVPAWVPTVASTTAPGGTLRDVVSPGPLPVWLDVLTDKGAELAVARALRTSLAWQIGRNH